jgi:apolipoprotein N-acyltransferase
VKVPPISAWRRGAEAAAAGLLLWAAYPPLEWAPLAWIALVPLWIAVAGRRAGTAARLGFLAGAAFWIPALTWLWKVTILGSVILSLYCAAWFIPPALVAAAWTRRFGSDRAPANLGGMAAVALAWAGAEYVRSFLFTGFHWNGLGVSQYRNTALIQCAEWGGVFAVSAVIAWANAAAAATLAGYLGRGPRRRLHPEMILGALVVAAAATWGGRRAAEIARRPPAGAVRLALVQPAVPQYAKWDETFVEGIYDGLESLTRAALRARPDLVVWPETAVPDVLRAAERPYRLLYELSTNGVPLLVGTLEAERADAGDTVYFNSTILVEPGGRMDQVYDKQHLVLFGEYIPFSRQFPILRALTPVPYDVTPGTRPHLFRLEGREAPFAALICFEDTVPGLARDFVRRGARFLVTQTNDAWYDFSAGSLQHFAQSVFRCVETRVPMARCGNTGITGWIDAAGRIGGAGGPASGLLRNYAPGPALASGFLAVSLPEPAAGSTGGGYRLDGDRFGAAGAVAALLLLAGLSAPAAALASRALRVHDRRASER